MGFCQRCGEIVTNGPRCKCGGTAKDTSTKLLFKESPGDKWSQSYLSKSSKLSAKPTPESSTRGTGSESSSSKLSPTSDSVFASPAKPSMSRNPSKTRPLKPARQPSNFEDHQLSSVFGSVLSPKDQWECVACQHKFAQEEVIYPHPDAKKDMALSEVYFCRDCFASRFSKGSCKRCKCAVLSDAPFIKHEDRLWHDSCYVCSYCSDPKTAPVIDFSGNPSCENCFDAEAYKTRGIPPSPHLAQNGFAFEKPNLRPAPSKWGSGRAKMSPVVHAAGSTEGTGNEPNKGSAWSARNRRERSPMVASFDEMGHRFRELGLEPKRPAPMSSKSDSSTSTPPRFSESAIAKPAVSMATSADTPIRATQSRSDSPTKGSFDASSWTRVPSPTKTPQLTTPKDSNICAKCHLDLGYDELIQLPKNGNLMHKACFVCSGCRKQLDQGRHVEAEEGIFHQKCAPPPRLYRTLVTSLAEPIADGGVEGVPPTASYEIPLSCEACKKPINSGFDITTPRTGKSYHVNCFTCGGCSKLLVDQGQRIFFVEVRGIPYHPKCAPSTPSASSESTPRASSPLRSSTSRASPSLPLAPSQPKIFHTPPASSNSPVNKPRSIFATRERPPVNLGGLLICAGCGVRAVERETRAGPLGRRYHPRCLKCGMCNRALDSESRIGAYGQLRCEACRKMEARTGFSKSASSGIGHVNPPRMP